MPRFQREDKHGKEARIRPESHDCHIFGEKTSPDTAGRPGCCRWGFAGKEAWTSPRSVLLFACGWPAAVCRRFRALGFRV